ncbi:family 78 glycoside hydrolase catalytic domain [Algibacillus agarilyticus]|uniref:family 78 glycoside hydrolase catalytic domain n=1 Tax=Algibacillus agarilyticus TaxID=2234133 RepID=UPI000DCFC481|nr:alpha-L-rhamnosidase [Algibacillus agarilyticus]
MRVSINYLEPIFKKIKRYFVWLCLSLFIISCGHALNAPVNSVNTEITHELSKIPAPIKLKIAEGGVEPIGFYESKPRFSWQLPLHSIQKYQHSYQLQVSKTASFATKNLIWDSGQVESNNNAWQRFKGKPLQSRQSFYWRVRTWGLNSSHQHTTVSKWSKSQFVELGLLNNHDWQAQWIGHEDIGPQQTQPQYLRKQFNVQNTVKQARLYITAKGVFKPYINGQAVSDDVMTPGWTPYHKRIETLTYDVTHLLKPGENAIGAILAAGWHTGRIFSPQKEDYTLPMRLLAQLEITYHDGSQQTITSNPSWQATRQGPIRQASNYDGETYDANFEMPGWNTINFNAQNWQPVVTEHIDHQVDLKPKRHTAPRVTVTLPAIKLISIKNGIAIYDMGQNMVGVPEITVPTKKGQTIKLRFSEALEHDKFYVKNLRSAKNVDYYIPKSDGIITYRPTFTFHGYRYVEISGYDTQIEPQINWLSGQVIHSDFNVYDNFSSNHTKLNQLSDNISWGLRGNFLDIPTDCPQRDERLGWTGDAQIFVSTSMYKADVYAFWAAWLESLREEQSIDGMLPKFVPFRQFLSDGASAAWGDAATIVPWELYQYTGDLNVLAENYNMMKRWVLFSGKQSVNYISNMETYGDWLQPHSKSGRKGDTHPDMIATAYYARTVDIAARTARLLGYKSDGHLRTGFLGTPMLHQVLQRYGYSDVMYDVLLKETYPSWFYSINNGATTTWERWNSYSITEGYNKANMNSLNHYAYGAVAQWFYNGMLGVQSLEPGFKTFKLEPQFTSRLNDISGRIPTINGDIDVSWSINNDKLAMTLIVPNNSRATLHLPTVTNLQVLNQAQPVNTNADLGPGKYSISGTIALNKQFINAK